MASRGGLFDPELNRKSLPDVEANRMGTFDPEFVDSEATAATFIPNRPMALTMAVLLSALPSFALDKPNFERQKIAPLTLTYGQQPPNRDTLQRPYYQLIVGQWPDSLEPRLQNPNNRRQTIAPLTFTYGDQPPRVSALTYQDRQVIDSWPKEDWSAQSAPRSTVWQQVQTNVPYVTYPYVVLRSWQPDDLIIPKPTKIAPLTLTYGDQPTPQPSLTIPESTAIRLWPRDDWAAQRSPLSTAWTTIPSWNPFVPFQYATILASWPADLEPQPARVNLSRPRTVVLTLTYGDQPTPQPPLSLQERLVIDSWPREDWPAQRSPISYAWFVPPAWSPFIQYPITQILLNWPADLEPQPARSLLSRPKTVTLTFPAVDQPPRQSPISVPNFQIVIANQIPLNATQWVPPNAAWNIPAPAPQVIRPLKDYLDLLVRSWPADLEPHPARLLVTRPMTVPLTLVYGNQPTPRSPLLLQNRLIIDSWPQLLEPQPPYSLLVRPKTVPLTFTYGQQPPRKTIERMMQSILIQWPLDLEPRLGPPNERQQHIAYMLAHKIQIIDAVGSFAGHWLLYQSAVLVDGAIAYYPMDDLQSSGVLRDIVGANNFNNIGTLSWQEPGMLPTPDASTGFNIGAPNSPSGFAKSGDAPQLHITDKLTVEFWLKGNASLPAVSRAVFRFTGPDVGVSSRFLSRLSATIKMQDASAYTVNADGLSLIGTVYHVVYTYDGAALNIYINGVLAATIPATGLLDLGTSGITLGGQPGWVGDMERLSISPVALTPAQVLSHYILGYSALITGNGSYHVLITGPGSLHFEDDL